MRGMPLPVKAAGGLARGLVTAAALLTLAARASSADGPVLLDRCPRAVEYTPGARAPRRRHRAHARRLRQRDAVPRRGQEARFTFDDLSLFVIYEPIARLRFFSELEYADVFTIDEDGETEGREESRHRRAALRRRRRLGCRQSPRGRHLPHPGRALERDPRRAARLDDVAPAHDRAPLRPERHRHHAVRLLFPAAGDVTWSVYGQFTDQFDPVSCSRTRAAQRRCPARVRCGGRVVRRDVLPRLESSLRGVHVAGISWASTRSGSASPSS